MKRLFVHGLTSLALMAATVLCSSQAHAFEKQWHLGGGPGLAWLHRQDTSSFGPVAEFALSYGLTDQFNALAEITFSPHSFEFTPEAKTNFTAFQTNLGVAYTLDVIQWVPYAGVLAGVSRLGQGTGFGEAFSGKQGTEINLDLVGALGLDYQYSRSLGFGIAGRFHWLATASEATQYTTVTLRAYYTWGY
jgi:hypothetical protein